MNPCLPDQRHLEAMANTEATTKPVIYPEAVFWAIFILERGRLACGFSWVLLTHPKGDRRAHVVPYAGHTNGIHIDRCLLSAAAPVTGTDIFTKNSTFRLWGKHPMAAPHFLSYFPHHECLSGK
jgi:hypothetical protein